MEKTYVIRVIAVDELGKETPSLLPLRLKEAPTARELEEQLNDQYPHLKHRIVEIQELKTPEEVEDWQHSYMGFVFGSEHQSEDGKAS